MDAWRAWWCKVAGWTFWPVVKAIGLTLMVGIVAIVAMLIGWTVRWVWLALFHPAG